MTPFIQAIGLLLSVAAVVAVACFLIAWVDIAMHRGPKSRPNPAEMRRFMLCGFYCNPEDRRPVVHRFRSTTAEPAMRRGGGGRLGRPPPVTSGRLDQGQQLVLDLGRESSQHRELDVAL